MTLGSALPWRACSPLGRITIQSRRRQGLPLSSVLNDLRAVRSPAIVRLQSTNRTQPTDAGTLESFRRPRGHDAAATDAPHSLLDHLDRTPLWLHGEEDPVVVRPVVAYPDKREAREALLKKHRALTQQARVERRRQMPRAGDWRAILDVLMRRTPTCAPVQDGIKVIIPEQSVKLLWSDYENNVWNIKSRTGCDMTLYRPVDVEEAEGSGERQSAGVDRNPYIILSGRPTAVSAAVHDILKVTKAVTVIGLQGGTPTMLHEERAPSTRSAALTATPTRIPHYPMTAPCRPYMLRTRADQIPRPSEWTIESFQHYVAALTMGRVPQSLAAKLYPGADTHQDTVVRLLHDLFNDPAASAAVSNPTFKLALEYVVRAGETFVKDARSLFGSLGALGLRLDAGVYNLLAETSVKSKNLLAFESTVRRMTASKHAPNLRTWLLFLRMVEAEDVKRYILHAMYTKNFFADPRTAATVSVELADHDVHRAIQLGQDVDTFLAGLRALYGPAWRLQRRAANRYLDVFGRYSKFEESRKLLEHMFASEHCTPNAISLNTVLTHCKLQHKVDLAVGFVRMFDQRRFHRVADDVTFHLLFEVARKTRKTYLQSAVWRCAHVLGKTRYRMRDRGIKLLTEGDWEREFMTYWIRPLWGGPDGCKISKRELFETLLLCDARRFEEGAAGQRLVSRSEEKAFEHIPSAQDHPTSFLLGRLPEERAEDEYRLYADCMSRLAQRYVPAVPLGDFLQAALDYDRKLRKMVLDGEKVPDAMLLHAADLPLASKRAAGEYRANPVLEWLAQRAGAKTEEDAITEGKMHREEAAAGPAPVVVENDEGVAAAAARTQRSPRPAQADLGWGLMAEMTRLEAAQLSRQREGMKRFGAVKTPMENPSTILSGRDDVGLGERTSQVVIEPLQQESPINTTGDGGETEGISLGIRAEAENVAMEARMGQEVAEPIREEEPMDKLGDDGERDALQREIRPKPVTTEKATDILDVIGPARGVAHSPPELANVWQAKEEAEGFHKADVLVANPSKADDDQTHASVEPGAHAQTISAAVDDDVGRLPEMTAQGQRRTRPRDSEENNAQPSDGGQTPGSRISWVASGTKPLPDRSPPPPRRAARRPHPSTVRPPKLESKGDHHREEDVEARERAHAVLHHLLNVADRFLFGNTAPRRAGTGTGTGVAQHPGGLGTDLSYAGGVGGGGGGGGGSGGGERMASGYHSMLGPSRDYGGARVQSLAGHHQGGRYMRNDDVSLMSRTRRV
ncbi:hypothetical protein N658DRAFT_493680 [Parathielavia hyrcaniae]|uniref:Pentatricopeptide repeat domain-containing protein n=1 Tax=Parathielavia hyrcaniae TaxID=113614 RepID=A0AAN6Q5Z5_9PEZI|nr:hypothetical protein N658DRAFT_493680 [Parathielavia hyrcaniae]